MNEAKKQKMGKKKKLALVAVVLSFTVLGAALMSPDVEPAKQVEVTKSTTEITWAEQAPMLEELAKQDLTPQEKNDKAMAMAKEFKPTDENLKEFEMAVKADGKKLALGALQLNEVNETTTVFMLFKGRVLELHNKQTDLGELASDYLQIVRDVYRGVDTPDDVESNIEQIKNNPELNK